MSVTPVPFANSTLILLFGRSSGFCGSTTLLSLTINICFATSIVDLSLNVTSSVPSYFPAASDVLAGSVLSVTVASFSRAATLSLFASVVAFTPFDQSIGSFTHTFIVSGLSPPSSVTSSAVVFFAAVAVNVLLSSVTTLSSGVHVAGSL